MTAAVSLVQAARVDLTVFRGDAITWPVIYKNPSNTAPIDITGWTAELNFRAAPGGAILLTLSSAAGDIANGGSNGTFTVSCTVAQARQLTQNGVYDLYVVPPNGAGFHLLAGTVTVTQSVTP